MIPVKHIPEVINTHRSRGEPERIQWDKWHSWYQGDFQLTLGDFDDPGNGQGDSEIALETNVPYAFIDTMCANICPPNPQVTIRALDPSKRESAGARTAFVNEMMRRDKVKRKARRIAAFGALCGRGISKTVWNRRSRQPSTSIIDPRFFFYDMSAETWEEITYCFEATVLRRDQFEKRRELGIYSPYVSGKVKATAYPEWMKDRFEDHSYLTRNNRSLFEWVVIYDFYDFEAGQFYQWADECWSEPLLATGLPYPYAPNPYDIVMFNENLRCLDGISDVKLIERPLERLNEIDTLELQFAHSCIPTPHINENAFESPEDAKSQFSAATNPGDAAWYKLRDDRRIDQVISWSQPPPLSPSWDRMRQRTEGIVEKTLGLPAYARGTYDKGELATEVALSDEATRTRNGWRIDVIEEWVASIAKKGLAIWKYELGRDRDIFIHPPGEADSVQVNRHSLAFAEPDVDGKMPAEDFDDDYYQFETVAYSPAENSRQVRLQTLQQFAPLLLQMPTVDKVVLTRELLDLIQLSEAALDPKAQQPAMAVQGQPGVPGASGVQGSPEAMAQPGPSPETEALLPPDVRTGGGRAAPAMGM